MKYEKTPRLKKATTIEDIPNAFSAAPLSGKDLDIFYNETMAVRTADMYTSPIDDIYETCTGLPSPDHIFLLMGHRGCGKSTELNKMAERMMNDGFQVRIVPCQRDIGSDPIYTDLLILMGEALIDIAREIGCDPDSELGHQIQDFWNTEIVQLRESKDDYSVSMTAGSQLQTPSFFEPIFKMFAALKTSIKLKQSDSVEYRKKIERRSSQWYSSILAISDSITEKLGGKQPIVIFEDLDKLDNVNPDILWKMFAGHAENLCNFTFPVIYTFPIALSYDPEYGALFGYTCKTIPMIEIEYINGEECKAGINCIRKIISSRAEDYLFDESALLYAIRNTGGSLRDLFRVIREASTRARRRRATCIEQQDVDVALNSLCSDLRKRVETKDYDFLRRIMDGNRLDIEDKEKLLTMIKADVILEYNSKRWHNVHPMVAAFLKEGQ